MPFISAPNCAEAVIRFTLPNGNIAVNVLNFRRIDSTDYTLTTLTDLTNRLKTWHAALYDLCQSNQVSLTSIYARDLSNEFGAVVDVPVSPAQVGAVASPALPANVTLSISHRTGFAGRSYRGRSYVVGLSEGSVAGDFVGSSAANLAQTAFNGLRGGDFVLNGHEFVILSRYTDGAPRSEALPIAVTQSLYVDLRVDTQRRRLIGEGS